VAVGGRVGVARKAVSVLEWEAVTCGVAVGASKTTLAVADEVAWENHQVTDVDVDAKRVVVDAAKARDRVHDADG
jgi:hypothetical protein